MASNRITPLTVEVKAQVAPESSGSGYFMLAFMGATKGISRVTIRLAATTRSLGRVTTDASGRYAFPLRAAGTEPFQVQWSYTGSGDSWPAQSISRNGPCGLRPRHRRTLSLNQFIPGS